MKRGFLVAVFSQMADGLEQDTIVVTGSRAPDETTLQGDFIKRETLTSTWTHNWSDRVDTSLGGTIGRDTYEGSLNDREDDIYNISFDTQAPVHDGPDGIYPAPQPGITKEI